MVSDVTISQPDVIEMIEDVAAKLAGGDTTQAVAIAPRNLRGSTTPGETLFGANPG